MVKQLMLNERDTSAMVCMKSYAIVHWKCKVCPCELACGHSTHKNFSRPQDKVACSTRVSKHENNQGTLIPRELS